MHKGIINNNYYYSASSLSSRLTITAIYGPLFDQLPVLIALLLLLDRLINHKYLDC